LTSKSEATISSKNPDTKLRIANAILTFCFILFTLAYAFSISITQAAAYSGIVAWLAHTHLTHSWNKTQFILVWPIGLFFLAGALSIVTAQDPTLSFSGLKKILKAIVFFWVINALTLTRPLEFFAFLSQRLKNSKIGKFIETWIESLKNAGPLNFLIGIMIAGGVSAAGYGIIQAFTQQPAIWSRAGVHGTLSNIMTYSVIMMLIASLTLARVLFGPRNSKTILIGALVFFGGAITLTMIRQAWLGFFVAASFLFFIRKKVLILGPILLVGLILIFGPHVIAKRLKSIIDPQQASNHERIMLLEAGWDVFKDYPLTGCGFKCLLVVADQYPQHPILQTYKHLHSNILQIAVDTGAIGLVAWISIWVLYFVHLIRRSRQIHPDANDRWVIFGSAAAVIAFLVSGMFENNFYDSEIIILVYFIMALPFVDFKNNKSSLSNPQPPSIP